MYGYYTGADWPVMRMFGARTQGAASPSAEVPVLGDNERRQLPRFNRRNSASAPPILESSVPFSVTAARAPFRSLRT